MNEKQGVDSMGPQKSQLEILMISNSSSKYFVIVMKLSIESRIDFRKKKFF